MNTEVQSITPTYEELLSTNRELLQIIAQQNLKIEELTRQLDWFKKQLFGEKSEKRIVKTESDQKQLEFGEMLIEETKVESENVTIKEHTKLRRKEKLEGSPEDTGLRFDESQVPVKEVVLENPEIKNLSKDEYELLSEKVSYKLAQQPGIYFIIKYVQPVIKIKATAKIINTPAPKSVLEKSYADVSLLVCLLLDKFLYHLPLYRQHQRLKASGIMISRATLTNYVLRSADLLKQISLAQMRSILRSHILSMDETLIKCGHKEKGKMQQCYFWPMYGDSDEVSFMFTKNRKADWLEKELRGAGFSGTLVVDGYAAYTKLRRKLNNSFTLANCWAHARREFVKAEEVEPELVSEALRQIGELYKHEKLIRESGLEEEDKFKYRTEHIKDLVEQFFLWLSKQQQVNCLLPTNKFSQAVAYALKRENELKVFLSDPEVPIDNNHTERVIRPLVMGRKNYLFCWSEVGGEAVAHIQSLIITCRLQGIDPYEYLVDVLQRVESHPQSKVLELTPRIWKEKFQSQRLKSPAEKYQLI